MNILLLNPPGKQIYLRDYYCSKVSKADYILHPVDLYMLSGILAEKHTIHVIDAIVERMPEDECIKRILSLGLDAIIFLTGQVSFESDFMLLEKIKEQRKHLKMIGTGDIFMENGEDVLKRYNFLDAAILDFTTDDILQYLDGQKANNMIYGSHKTVKREKWGEFNVPVPRHDLFRNDLYTSPFMKHRKLVTVLTDYGCPYKCDFCIMGTIGSKFRSVDNVMEELNFVKSLGIKEIYFDDQTFGINKKRSQELLIRMKGMGFVWSCLSRADVMTEDFVKLMKEAGCHTVILGVESGSQKILDDYHKATTKEKIKSAFKMCQKHGICTVGTFIIGLPGETKEDVFSTIHFAKELKCDYASFNTPVARMNTPMRKEAKLRNIITDEIIEMDQSGDFGILGTPELSSEEIQGLRDRAIQDFYFRFSYFVQRVSKLKTFFELKSNIKSGLAIWRKNAS